MVSDIRDGRASHRRGIETFLVVAFEPQKSEYAQVMSANLSDEFLIVDSEIFFNRNTLLKCQLSVLEIEVYSP